jgi:hypothetical protein
LNVSIAKLFLDALPAARPTSVVSWAEQNVRLPGSVRSERFDILITPWLRDCIECAGDPWTRICTFVKPVQGGGSVVGEIALCFWLATESSGDVQYNWEDDQKAGQRWGKRIVRILKACKPVMQRWPTDRHKANKGLVMFPHCNLTVQGVFTADNLDSDSIRFQINEELHTWESGRLDKAYRRKTAAAFPKTFNISNAGSKNDQLHHALRDGTNQEWEVLCPGCGKFHALRAAWDDKMPKLGGLRYDSAKCRHADGSVNYNRLAPTIRYQMPCGYAVRDTPPERRALSLSGRYGAPRNKGAHLSNRSFTLEAVSVDYITWLLLIQEKQAALRALKFGDPEPYRQYLQERECRFWDPEDRPLTGKIVLNTALKKDRAGLEGRFGRYFALDRQLGSLELGELPHWWLVIRDAMPNGDSRLVFEGKVLTDEDVIAILDRHECLRRHGVADSGADTTHVYTFCLRFGVNAVKGSSDKFAHRVADPQNPQEQITVYRIFSVEKPLHAMIGQDPTCLNAVDEPQFWFYSKTGIRERLHWLRAGGAVKWEVPGDVSDDYKAHMEAEELRERRGPRGEVIQEWVQLKKRNDLYVCECYISMLLEMAGLIGQSKPAIPA